MFITLPVFMQNEKYEPKWISNQRGTSVYLITWHNSEIHCMSLQSGLGRNRPSIPFGIFLFTTVHGAVVLGSRKVNHNPFYAFKHIKWYGCHET